MKWNGKLLPILFGLSLTTFGISIVALLYPLLTKNKNDDEEKKYWSKKSKNSIVTSRKPTRLEVLVPKQRVSAIIGKNGSVINDIQEKTGTYITIERNEDLDHPCVKIIIQGDEKECVMLAKCLINEKVETKQNIEIRKMILLSSSQYVQILDEAEYIQTVSGAKLTFLNNPLKGGRKEYKLSIKGTAEQIEKAVSEIEKTSLEQKKSDKTTCDNPNNNLTSDFLSLKVYISAIESLDQFWIQVIGPKFHEFEKLENEMAEYYECNCNLHYLSNIEANKIVAVKHEGKWYRAEIKDFDLFRCTIYLLDYGNIVKDFPTNNVFELRTDMLSLQVQALECKLGYIRPPKSELKWSSDAIQMFSALVQPGKKKVVIAKSLDFVTRSNTLSCRDYKWVPELVLYLENFTDVAQTLVDLQLAETIFPSCDILQKPLPRQMQEANPKVNECKE